MGFQIEIQKYENTDDLISALDRVIATVKSVQWCSRKVIELNDDSFAKEIDKLLRINFSLMIRNKISSNEKKTSPDEEKMLLEEKKIILKKIKELSRVLENPENTDNVKHLQSLVERCITLFQTKLQFNERIFGTLPLEIELEILSHLPASTDSDLQKSIATLDGYELINASQAHRAWAYWINRQRIPLEKTKWANGQRTNIFPYLRYLDLRCIFEDCYFRNIFHVHFYPCTFLEMAKECPYLDLSLLPGSTCSDMDLFLWKFCIIYHSRSGLKPHAYNVLATWINRQRIVYTEILKLLQFLRITIDSVKPYISYLDLTGAGPEHASIIDSVETFTNLRVLVLEGSFIKNNLKLPKSLEVLKLIHRREQPTNFQPPDGVIYEFINTNEDEELCQNLLK